MAHKNAKQNGRVANGGGEPYDFTKQVGYLLRKTYQWHVAIFQEMCADPHLTTAQFAILCAINDQGPSSLTAIGRKIVMDPATTRGIVDRLRERGLVSLLPDKTDRRRVIVDLSEAGRRLLARVIPSAAAITDRTMEPLNPAERVALLYLLHKLSRNFTVDEQPDAPDETVVDGVTGTNRPANTRSKMLHNAGSAIRSGRVRS